MITVKDVQQMEGVTAEMSGRIKRNLAAARKQTHEHVFQKLTTPSKGLPRIIDQPPLLYHADIKELSEPVIAAFFKKYRETLPEERRMLFDRFKVIDTAVKVVGVGSVGTRCWVVLMLGRDHSDPLFLQVKEAEKSVLAPFVGASKHANQGQRVVAGQRLMQATSDIFLGWQRTEAGLDGRSRDFYVRQLRDWKFSVDIAAMIPRGLRLYGELCGLTLARAHARSGDEIAIAAYLGGSDVFENAIADFSAAYADQNERDYQAFTAAIASGRLVAERGV